MYSNPTENHDFLAVSGLLRQKPHGVIRLKGGDLRGMVRLYPLPRGVLAAAEVSGLPSGRLFDLTLEGEEMLPPLLAHRGRSLQVMVLGGCTVEDLMGRRVTLSSGGDSHILAQGTVEP